MKHERELSSILVVMFTLNLSIILFYSLICVATTFRLCVVSILKSRRPMERFPLRMAICVAEIMLCAGIVATLDFYYSGVALLVLADLVHYVRSSRIWLCFIVILTLLFAFRRYEIVAHSTGSISFDVYLNYYDQAAQSWFTGQQSENTRIRKLNEQLNQANDQLRDYAVNMERMAEMRERNRLAREIHDTL